MIVDNDHTKLILLITFQMLRRNTLASVGVHSTSWTVAALIRRVLKAIEQFTIRLATLCRLILSTAWLDNGNDPEVTLE